MKRINPDNILDGAKDVGIAALVAVPVAVALGGAAVAASHIDYTVTAGDMFTPEQKRSMLVGAGALVAGVLMQLSSKTAGIGKLLGAGGVLIPAAMVARDKIATATAPAVVAVNPLVAAPNSAGFYGVSGGMPGFGQSSYIPVALPPGYQPSGLPNFTPAAFVPVVR